MPLPEDRRGEPWLVEQGLGAAAGSFRARTVRQQAVERREGVERIEDTGLL